MKATRLGRTLAGLLALAALALAGCEPGGPPGVNRDDLDAQVSRAIGDPTSCLLIGRTGSGRVIYRYNTATTCDRELPNCTAEGLPAGRTKVKALLEATARDGKPRRLSCSSNADGSRGVGWASGPVEGTDMVYAAVMEGERSFPGMMMADRIEGALRRAKVSRTAAK